MEHCAEMDFYKNRFWSRISCVMKVMTLSTFHLSRAIYHWSKFQLYTIFVCRDFRVTFEVF